MPAIVTDFFDNFAGIAQAAGTIGSYSWFFRARGLSWTFHLVEDEKRKSTCVERQPGDYWATGDIPRGECLTNQEVSEIIDRCLNEYWQSRGQFARH